MLEAKEKQDAALHGVPLEERSTRSEPTRGDWLSAARFAAFFLRRARPEGFRAGPGVSAGKLRNDLEPTAKNWEDRQKAGFGRTGRFGDRAAFWKFRCEKAAFTGGSLGAV